MPLYQHRFVGNVANGDQFVFSFWSFTAETSASVMNDAAVQWATDLWNGPSGTDGYASMTTSSVVINRIGTGEIDVATGKQQRLADADVNLAGTATGNAFPADVAIVVSLRTELANRRGRGRFYLPQPAVSTGTAPGRLVAATQTALADALANAWAGFNVTASPVVYSRTSRATEDITSFNVGDMFDTQRRRENAVTEVRASRVMP